MLLKYAIFGSFKHLLSQSDPAASWARTWGPLYYCPCLLIKSFDVQHTVNHKVPEHVECSPDLKTAAHRSSVRLVSYCGTLTLSSYFEHIGPRWMESGYSKSYRPAIVPPIPVTDYILKTFPSIYPLQRIFLHHIHCTKCARMSQSRPMPFIGNERKCRALQSVPNMMQRMSQWMSRRIICNRQSRTKMVWGMDHVDGQRRKGGHHTSCSFERYVL